MTRLCVLLCLAPKVSASVLATVRGVVHDSSHRRIAGAHIDIVAMTSQFRAQLDRDASGAFEINSLPVGEYRVTVTAPGFAAEQQKLFVHSGAAPVLHVELPLAGTQETVHVTDEATSLQTVTPATETTIARQQIERYAGMDQTNSLRVITQFVPGSYVVHDQLHVRGGHKVTWAIDGVPLPNTNISTNVGPQFDPKDIDYLEASTGGYSADYGDRTYGIFNVATRTGLRTSPTSATGRSEQYLRWQPRGRSTHALTGGALPLQLLRSNSAACIKRSKWHNQRRKV